MSKDQLHKEYIVTDDGRIDLRCSSCSKFKESVRWYRRLVSLVPVKLAHEKFCKKCVDRLKAAGEDWRL